MAMTGTERANKSRRTRRAKQYLAYSFKEKEIPARVDPYIYIQSFEHFLSDEHNIKKQEMSEEWRKAFLARVRAMCMNRTNYVKLITLLMSNLSNNLYPIDLYGVTF
ncbi:hypothetical protein J4N45_14515 [Vibrio sp. SCSIO 43140]|uniref:hypothetical protein n=1 Tax=Vibrio sp. SCSIO 43140 TaxID=2819100 RepID=UPI00207654EA|nr:hypothetical protein [Vibrio sp. SCSIO 43140]USD58799.1 hypothetical protein J4N45_09670 [Vibrio sp. SCSIO 43140]USD59133.1 hypothetical protein J4N45_11375 [Vibrio sp. SCSIO 43140]USD59714.1 hypothetical protein J4N45_14515 [Vibrio sp. SCSIO 43140]